MKNNYTLLLSMLCSIVALAQEKTKAQIKETEKEDRRKFYIHSFEFQLTPSADYFLYSKGRIVAASDPYDNRLPFIGFNLGGQYIFRPIHLVSVSGGLNFRMQGYFNQTKAAVLGGDLYISSRTNGHVGYLSIPIYAHLYKKMPHSTFEFATGPEFSIPLFSTSYYRAYSPAGDVTIESNSTTNFSQNTMKENASFGWSIFLGAELPAGKGTDFFVGPQIHFLDLARFNKDLQLQRTDNGGYYQFSLGLKFGFRFHKK